MSGIKRGFLDKKEKKKKSYHQELGPLRDARSLKSGPGAKISSWGNLRDVPTVTRWRVSSSHNDDMDLGDGRDWKLPEIPNDGVSEGPATRDDETMSDAVAAADNLPMEWDKANMEAKSTISTVTTASTSHGANSTLTVDSFKDAIPTPVHSAPWGISWSPEEAAGGDNPYRNLKRNVHKTSGVPKAALYTYYGQKPRRKQLANDDYHTWNNGARPHEQLFTSIFQCPIDGECYRSGRYGHPRFYTVRQEGDLEVVWYTKKSFAEHGAAARCFDCLNFRDQLLEGGDGGYNTIGEEAVYLSSDEPPLPSSMPSAIRAKLMGNKTSLGMNMRVEDAVI